MILLTDQQTETICGGGTTTIQVPVYVSPINVSVQNSTTLQNNFAIPIAVSVLKGSASTGPIDQSNNNWGSQLVALSRFRG